MTPLSAGAPIVPACGSGAAPARAGVQATDSQASGFDALLTPTAGSGKTPVATAEDSPSRRDSGTSAEADAPEAESAAGSGPGAGKPSADDADPHDIDTPWPPPGLSALIPPPAEPAPLHTVPPSAAGATAEGAMLGGGLPQALPPAVPAATVPPAAATQPPPETVPPIALPADTVTPPAEDRAAPPDLKAFAQVLQGVAPPEVRTPAAPSSVAPTPAPDLRSADFDDAFGARIGWLAGQKIGHAHIRITPQDMGQIEVKLQLDGDRVHASFSSAHAEVRSALENSLPRLREMLGEQGLELAQADVGQQREAPAGKDARDGAGAPAASAAEDADSSVAGHAVPLRYLRGLLDTYA